MDGFVTFLVTICLSMVGSWYLQKNLLKGQVMDHITKELSELRTKVNTLEGEIEQLKDDIKEQKKQITDQNALIKDLKSKYEESIKDKGKGRNSKFENTQLVPQVKGPPGPQGVNGPPGPPGPKGDAAKGGIVYVRWGHDSCPDGGAQLVYAGRAGGSSHSHRGGGGNPQCLPLYPEYHQRQAASSHFGYMFGAEYQETDRLVADSHDTDVPCAVCHVPTRNAVYMLPAKYSCPEGWTREYFGYLMSEYHGHHRSDFSCVDYSLTPVLGSKPNLNGFLFYAVRGACGSLPCPRYIKDKELSCAVCTK